jgi:thiamine monophosphate synthase
VPPPLRRRGPADAREDGAVRGVLRRVAAAVAVPVVAIGVTSLYWSREVVAAPVVILLGLLLVVVEVRILGAESWHRARRAWRRR